MWVFSQLAGLGRKDGIVVFSGYAGRNKGKNAPALQEIHAGCRWQGGAWVPQLGLTADDWGPLPCGVYNINPPKNTLTHGPYVLWLTPDKSNEMFGRSGFGIHGDSLEHPGLASEGCIVLPPGKRSTIWQSGDTKLQVISGISQVTAGI